MGDSTITTLESMTEAELEPLLKLLQGDDPDKIAKKAGVTREELMQMRDDLLAQTERERTMAVDVPPKKVGRNEPCPCGSGKKYKQCCLEKHAAAKCAKSTTERKDIQENRMAKEKLIQRIDKAFAMLSSANYTEAIRSASGLLKQYPNEDRLHDIVSTSHLYSGDCEKAIQICQERMDVAEAEKAYFIKHQRYRDAEIDKPALAYYYPPLTWMQKYWIALKARQYQAGYSKTLNPVITSLVKELQSADNTDIFPAKNSQGFELRKNALKKTLDALKTSGPETILYILPLACKYSWAGLFVPEILSAYQTDTAIRSLIDISMFGFSYASGASLHFLEKLGERAVPYIEAAFLKDTEFDPIKTGIVSVLGNIRGIAAYDLLVRLLDHESSHIVNWAGDALAKFKTLRAIPAMMAANERIGGEKMIGAAINYLKELDDAS